MKTGNLIILSIATAVVLQFNSRLAAQEMDKMWGEQNAENAEVKVKRGRFLDWGNYAMFVHWGLYSRIGNKWEGKTYYGNSEWIMNNNMANIPVDEYKATARNFNPDKFSAKELA